MTLDFDWGNGTVIQVKSWCLTNTVLVGDFGMCVDIVEVFIKKGNPYLRHTFDQEKFYSEKKKN